MMTDLRIVLSHPFNKNTNENNFLFYKITFLGYCAKVVWKLEGPTYRNFFF